jgi:benzoylformate decarboxylase
VGGRGQPHRGPAAHPAPRRQGRDHGADRAGVHLAAGDILNNEAAIDLAERTRVDTAVRPSDAALAQLARRLLSAKNVVMLAGHEIVTSDAFAEAAELAETLGVPVWHQTVGHGAHFPSEHPCYLARSTATRSGCARS